MAINFNTEPYFDDFDETKNYHQILFKPGVALQARELNQLQTELANQIAKFGSHVFAEGAIVLNSERFFENNLLSIKYTGNIDKVGIVGKVIVGETSEVRALVKAVSTQTDGTRIIYKILSGKNFLSTERLTYVNDFDEDIFINVSTSDTFGKAMIFSVNAGVIFVRGKFVYSEKQTIVLNDESNLTSHIVGFAVSEKVISSEQDESLLDNAQNTPNFAAPGADRYFIGLSLISRPVETTSTSFIEIAKITNGELTSVIDRTIYAELEKEFARRTFDESGNYTVKPFSVSFQDHISTSVVQPIITSGVITGYRILKAGDTYTSTPTVKITGDGRGATAEAVIDSNESSRTYQRLIAVNVLNGGSGYTADETFVKLSGDPNKFSAKLEAGKAYVKGYEFETKAPQYLTIDKARTTEFADNLDIQTFYGKFIYVNNLFNTFNTDTFETVELHDVVRASVSGATSLLGTAKIRFLDYVSGTIGSASTTYKFYLFDIVINSGKEFRNVESIVRRSGATVLAGANIDELSKIGGTAGGNAFLSGSDRTGLVFPLSHPFVKELRDEQGDAQNDYTFKRVFNNVNVTGGDASISTNNGLERFVGGAGSYSLSNLQNNYHFVVTKVGTSPYTVGQIITPTSAVGETITPGATQALSITFGSATGFTVSIIASINANAQLEKTKILQPYEFKIFTTPNTVINSADSIGIADIFQMPKIFRTTTDPTGVIEINPTTGVIDWNGLTFTDVTASYSRDNGQRDDYYDHGRIILRSNPPPAGTFIVVVYNYFTHSNAGFASVDSYSIPYESIQSFKSPTTGTVYNLTDCIDFRPRRVNNSTAFSNAQLPDPDIQFQTDYSYYVGRIDRIIATSAKTFVTKRGNPSTEPKVPTERTDGMSLYIIELPPYTKSLKDISVKFIENKRYTMRDIGKLETRIDNLEYYTQLSLLEKNAYEDKIVDANNLEKFKNGFFVDNFNTNSALENLEDEEAWSRQIWGWWSNRDTPNLTWNKGGSRIYSSEAGDSLNIDYKIAIDPLNSELRPEAITRFSEFKYNPSTSTNIRKTGSLLSLPYTEKTIVSNPVASKAININPFNVIAFAGNIKLEPSTDLWVETQTLPALNKLVDIRVPDADLEVRTVNIGSVGRGNAARTVTVGSSITNVDNVVGQQKTSLGSDVVNVQYVPFARARKIIATGKEFKPRERLYPFMEDESVSQYCRPLTLLQVTGGSVAEFEEDDAVQFRTGSSTGTIVGTATVTLYSDPIPSNTTRRRITVHNVTGTIPVDCFITLVGNTTVNAQVKTITNYALGNALIPDEFGLIGFEFNLPSNFIRTGLRTLRLIDNIDNIADGSESLGNAEYFSQGTLQSKQETILTTRSIQNQPVQTVLTQSQRYWYDPLAQSIIVDSRVYPQGYHVTSVDIFFKSKSSSIPVSLELTRMINGYPESVVTSIPFGVSVLAPRNVNVSSNGSVATRFKFPSPVHLVPGEYAIVLKANTTDYEVYVGEMGKTDIRTGQIISKQPNTGVLFKSQNASTWTAFQEEDLKFNLNIAQFQTDGVAEFLLETTTSFEYSLFKLLSSNITPAGTNIDWSYKGLNVGSPNVADTGYIPLTPNTDISLSKSKIISGANSFILRAEISSNNGNVSPVIDVEGLALLNIRNNINNTSIDPSDGEETSTGGNALARYVSKQIRLADAFDASNIVVTIDAYKPSGTDVRVYYKTSPTESTKPFDSNEWVRMELQNPVTQSTNIFDYKEHKYYPVGAFGAFNIPVDNPISPRFNIFAIKIVLVSSNSAVVPKVRNLRAIATES